MKRGLFLLGIVLLMNSNNFAQDENPFNNPGLIPDTSTFAQKNNIFIQEASYVGELVSNLHGGKKTGSVYLGMANLKFSFDTKNLGLWNGGEFFINGAGTHGATPSSQLFGDFQIASNIEAGDHIYLLEFWYKHSFDIAEISIGLQDLNSDLIRSQYAGSFINCSFGIPSLVATNIPAPIYPLTALGIIGSLNISDDLTLHAALFDGLPEKFDNNRYNINWELNRDNGGLFLSEIQYSTSINKLAGKIKFGGYYHSQLNETCEETGALETVFQNNYGFYMIADQMIWQKSESKSIGMFIQLAASPGSINMHDYYIGAGFTYQGLFNENGTDAFGIALANARFNCGEMKNETVVEMFYKYELTKNLYFQPDVQYIINPAGTEYKLNNSLAFLLRFGINF